MFLIFDLIFFYPYLFFFFACFFSPIVYFAVFLKLGYNCFIMLCRFVLSGKVNQLHVHIHPLPLERPPTPAGYHRARAERLALSSGFALAVSLTAVLYMSVLHFQFVPPSLVSTSVSLLLPYIKIHLYHFFLRFHKCMLICNICFSLSDFPMYDSLYIHPHVCKCHFQFLFETSYKTKKDFCRILPGWVFVEGKMREA